MLIYYIRHGDPIYDPDSLTELGKRQAEAIGKRLARVDIDRIYASSSNRAILTATPLSEMSKKEITVLDWCNEGYVWGEFTVSDASGTRWLYQDEKTADVLNSDEIRKLGMEWYNHPLFKETNCGKGMKRVAAAANEFLLELGYEHDPKRHVYKAVKPNNDRIAMFAHEGFSYVFLSYIMDIPYPMFTRFVYNHTGMTVIEFDGGEYVQPKILQYSSDSHLYKENLPTRLNNGIII